MRKQSGGNLFSALLPLARIALPQILETVGLSALTGAVSGGIEKVIKGEGLTGSRLFSVPQNKVDKLIQYKDYLTEAQKEANSSHWVCWRNIDEDVCEYFDSFGLSMPAEVEEYLIKSGKTLFYSPDEIQERLSVLCGYWCLYYLFERQNGKSIFEVLHNPEFDLNNQIVNYEFLKKYFSIK